MVIREILENIGEMAKRKSGIGPWGPNATVCVRHRLALFQRTSPGPGLPLATEMEGEAAAAMTVVIMVIMPTGVAVAVVILVFVIMPHRGSGAHPAVNRATVAVVVYHTVDPIGGATMAVIGDPGAAAAGMTSKSRVDRRKRA
jgi:hypothetical protein